MALSLKSLIFLLRFTAILSVLSLVRRTRGELWSLILANTLSVSPSTWLSRTLVASTPPHFSLHGRAGTLWSGLAFSSSLPSFFPLLSLLWSFCW